MEDAEWMGFTYVYIIGSALFHLPFCILLYFFSRALKKREVKNILLLYYLVLIGFGLSTCYYWLIFSSTDVSWNKFIPGLIYLVLLIPPLSLGLSGILRWKHPINTR